VTSLPGVKPRNRGLIHGRREKIFSSPRRPDGLCNLTSFLLSGYTGLSPEAKRSKREDVVQNK
jgi:hypothetical protein